MEAKLRTLTPIWTGGVDGKVDRFHEAGVLGSLRWWFEALVRGLGGTACDPSKHECTFDWEKYRQSQETDARRRLRDAGLCDVCQVFGATGWQRRFRLEVEDHAQPIWSPPDKLLNIRPPGRKRGWYLPPGKMGQLTLRFIGEPKALSLMAALLLFLEKWGGLGARPQLGYGVYRIENRDDVASRAKEWTWKTMDNGSLSENLPDLRRFVFFKFDFSPSQPGWWTKVPGLAYVARHVQPLVRRYQVAPVTPALRNEWRFRQWQRSWGDAREVFGTLRPDRKRSRVVSSWAHVQAGAWEVRGWAWLPPNLSTGGHLLRLLANQQIWAQVIHAGTLHSEGPFSTSRELGQFLEKYR